jgi:hypothetical protein
VLICEEKAQKIRTKNRKTKTKKTGENGISFFGANKKRAVRQSERSF